LVVDDTPENLRLIRAWVELAGYCCDTAGDGEVALAMLGATSYDAVVLDLHMPILDGGKVLREVRRTRNGVDIPILIATADEDPQAMVRLIDAGASDYLVKPMDREVFRARLQSVLRFRSQARGESPTPAVPPREEAAPGVLLDGRYRLDAVIGQGGFGTVYRGTQLATQRQVAVKILHQACLVSPTMRRRFELECRLTQQIRHPNVVEAVDFGTTSAGMPYLVMELLSGSSLAEEMDSASGKAPFPAPRIADLIGPICDALIATHALGVVHRDLKPENIWLHRESGREVVKLLDFGVAILAEGREKLTATNQIVGTLQYMAPEQLQGGPVDRRADVYALGLVLYSLLTGDFPFAGCEASLVAAIAKLEHPPKPLDTRPGGVDPDLAEIVMAALAFDPAKRPTLEVIRQAVMDHAARSAALGQDPPKD
jgi:DNA-binding response OmpR family regulator